MTTSAANNALAPIVGRRLTAVVFVMDYVQMQFEAPDTVLTAITLPKVTLSQHQFVEGAFGYRDALCGLIGKSVRNASVVEGVELRIELDNGAVLTVSLNSDDARGGEAATFSAGPGELAVW